LTPSERKKRSVSTAGLAEGLREPPRAGALVDFELPQAVLRVHEAEAELRVFDRARLDRRDAVRIALDADLGARAGDAQRAVGLRQHPLRVDPEGGRDKQHEQQHRDRDATQPFHRMPLKNESLRLTTR
jgi:hypothetical protein